MLRRILMLTALLCGRAFGLTPSSVSIISSPNPSQYGTPVMLMAAVPSGCTGKVSFYDGQVPLGVAAVSGLHATLQTVMLSSGVRNLRAWYSGDAVCAASGSSVLTHTVIVAPSPAFRSPAALGISAFSLGSIAIADFNGDGKMDLATPKLASSGVTVALGNGDGTFASPQFFTTNYPVAALAVGDFDGDGKPDIVASGGPSLNLLLGNGDGTFRASVVSVGNVLTNAVAVGDFNRDGRIDVLTGVNNYIALLYGNGDGTFQAPQKYMVGWTPGSLVIDDFNGDGIADVAVVNTLDNNVGVLLGKSDGTFAAVVNYAIDYSTVYSNPGSIVAGDFDGDGRADLAVLGSRSSITILLGNADGTFRPGGVLAAPAWSNVIVAEDFNGDGKMDLAVAGDSGSPAVFFGNGNATFQSASPQYGTTAAIMAIGEFTGDGKVDLVLGDQYGISLLAGGAFTDLTLTQTASGGFTAGQSGSYTITVTNAGDLASSGTVSVTEELASAFTATAIAGSGWNCVLATSTCQRADSLTSRANYAPITVAFNIAPGSYGNVTSTARVSGAGDQNPANNAAAHVAFIHVASSTVLTASPATAQVGQRVRLSATVTAGATGSVAFYDSGILLGSATLSGQQASIDTFVLPTGTRLLRAAYSGDSTYGPSISAAFSVTIVALPANGLAPPLAPAVPGGAQVAATADLNRDGVNDLIVAGFGGSSQGTLTVLLGHEDGTFGAPIATGVMQWPNTVVVADFNRDGIPDVAISTYDRIEVLLGNGDGSLQMPVVCGSAGYGYYGLIAADLNSDGRFDLLATRDGNLVMFAGNGNGTFQPSVTLVTGVSVSRYWVTDVNGDGKPDVVHIPASGDMVPARILLGNGDGTFQAPLSATIMTGVPVDYVLGDFNGDGKVDIAVTFFNRIEVSLGNGNGTFQTPIQSAMDFLPGSHTFAADVNGDGKLDLAMGGYTSSEVYVAFGSGDGRFSGGFIRSFDANPSSVLVADFNGDGRADLAVAAGDAVAVSIGGMFTGLYLQAAQNGAFTAGQTGNYQIVVGNPFFTASSGTVSVTDILPAGLTATSAGGSGWSCRAGSNTVQCARSDGLAPGAAYPPISLTVSIAGNIPPSVLTNQVTVTNGSTTNSVTPGITIGLGSAVSLTASPNPAVLGQAVTMTASVTGGTSGTVLFLDGVNPVGTAAVSGGHATFTTGLLPAGIRSLRATYTGDPTHSPLTSAAVAETITGSAVSTFSTYANYPTGYGPVAVALADLNLDGRPDLITSNSGANTISVLLGAPGGGFGPKTDYAAGISSQIIVVADFNNDGVPDVAVQNALLIGRSDGTLQPAVNFGATVKAMAAADVNADGKVDLLTIDTQTDSVLILFGKGDGSFQPGTPFRIGLISALTTADFNGDGKADIAYIFSNGIYVQLGNGDGTFQAAVKAPGVFSSPMATTDLDGDGKMDIVATSSGEAQVLLGIGDGTFQPAAHYPAGSYYSAPLLAVGDVTGDGRPDVGVAGLGGNVAYLLMGNSGGTLRSPVPVSLSSPVQTIAFGSVTGDDRADLLALDFVNSSVAVFAGRLLPVLSVTSSHTGTFVQGQQAAYSIVVSNAANATPTAGTVTVLENLPSGLTLVSMSGQNWSCASNTCTRSDPLPAGSSYPAITVTVAVAPGAASPQVNSVSVSGGGSAMAGAVDSTVIVPDAPILSITKAHTGSFAQGQNGATYTITVSNALGAGSTAGAVTVTDTAPSGLTLISMRGSGWNCPAGGATCTRSDALSGDSSYEPITATFHVSANAASPQVNSASVSGGGSGAASASDSTVIRSVPAVKVGSYNAGLWLLDVNGNGRLDAATDRSFSLGWAGATIVSGDWNGDGKTKAGVYSNGYWFLDYDGNGVWDGGVNDKLIAWGWAGATPIVGDWNGNGKTKIGVYSNGFWFLDYNGDFLWDGGVVDKQVGWGWAGVMPIVGDWNGDGKTKIGVYVNGFWFLDYDGNYVWDGGVADKQVGWGWAGVTPIVGDWNGDGRTKIGVYAGGYWYIDYDGNYLWEYPANDKIWSMGWAGTTPVMGDWHGDGKTKPGAFINGYWYLDYNGNGVFDGAGTDRIFAFGASGDTPVVGRW